MEPLSIAGLTLALFLLLGAALQSSHLFPNFFNKEFDFLASKLLVAAILLACAFGFIQLFLKTREGFQTETTPTAMDSWKKMTDLYQIEEVCKLKKQLEAKIFPIEKGSPPNQLSDQQARERTEKVFTEKTSHGSVNCEAFEKVQKAKDIDTFFVAVQELPNTFLIQVYETAERANNLLTDKVKEIDSALAKKTEGFVDPSVGVCSPEIVEERRKFLREKKLDEAAQRCLLPEEVPFESKDKVAAQKVKKIQDAYDAYIRMYPGKLTFDELLLQSKQAGAKLEEKKKAAESGDIFKGSG